MGGGGGGVEGRGVVGGRILGLFVGRSFPGFLDDWGREDGESTIMEGAEPRRGMQVWMGDFMHVVDVGLELDGVVSEPDDFCAVRHCMFAFLLLSHFFCQHLGTCCTHPTAPQTHPSFTLIGYSTDGK